MIHATGWASARGRVSGTIVAMLAMSASALAQDYRQAPMLDAKVESGALPPVEQRLPAEPLVVEPVESVGQYGGTWRSGLRGGLDNAWVLRTVAYDGLVRYDREWKGIIRTWPRAGRSAPPGGSTPSKLRDGLKWNNGAPFTSADIAFAAELVQDPGYAAGGFLENPQNPVKVKVIDDTTFSLVFEQPNGIVLDSSPAPMG